MSGREVQSALHLGLVFQQIPGTSTVPVASGETSRKRTADEEPDADVPSASRRRRSANADPSYIRPTFPACCVNGVVEQACLVPASPGYDPTAASNVSPPIPPFYGPQVISPQIHTLAPVPSTSVVHNVTPVTFVHGPPPFTPNYAYFFPHQRNVRSPHMMQPLMGLRLPTTPVHYMLQQDVHVVDRPFLPPLMREVPEEYPSMQRHFENFYAVSHPPPTMNVGNNWDTGVPPFRMYPSLYVPRTLGTRMESVVSRARVPQAAAQVTANQTAAAYATPAAYLLANRAHIPGQVNYYNDGWGDSNQNVFPTIDGPVAVPTVATDRAPSQGAIGNLPITNYQQQLEMARMSANGEIPMRAWEAAVLHIFDNMGPHVNITRLPPKGMTKNEIDRLKSFRIADPTALMEKVCVICQCDFEKRELVRMLPCAHHYHLKCIDKWLKNNRTCPICRRNAAAGESSSNNAEVSAGAALEDNVDTAAGAALENNVDTAAGAALENNVDTAAGAALEDNVDTAAGAALENNVDTAAGAALGNNVDTAAGAALEDNVDTAASVALEDNMDTAAGAALEDNVDTAAGVAIEDNVNTAADAALGDIVDTATAAALEDNVDTAAAAVPTIAETSAIGGPFGNAAFSPAANTTNENDDPPDPSLDVQLITQIGSAEDATDSPHLDPRL